MEYNHYHLTGGPWEAAYSTAPNGDELSGISNTQGTPQINALPAAPEPDMSYARGTRPPGATMMIRGYSGYSSQSSNSQAQAPHPSPDPVVPYSGVYDDFQYNLSAEGGYSQQGYLALPRYNDQPQSHFSQIPTVHQSHHYPSDEVQISTAQANLQSLSWPQDPNIWKNYQFKFADKKFPHLELCPNIAPSRTCPSVVYLEPSKDSRSSSGHYYCQHPDCADKKKKFKRSADLGRHYAGSHAATEEREQFHCCYRKCARSKRPFGRKDHYRDHIREYHKEDLPGKRFPDSEARQEWWAERKNDSLWWRCTKCLEKVKIAVDGFTCMGCNVQCEPDRAAVRRQMAGQSTQEFDTEPVEKTEQDLDHELDDEAELDAQNTSAGSATTYYPNCPTCDDNGWVLHGQDWIKCTVCPRGVPGTSASLNESGNSWANYDYPPYSNFQQ